MNTVFTWRKVTNFPDLQVSLAALRPFARAAGATEATESSRSWPPQAAMDNALAFALTTPRCAASPSGPSNLKSRTRLNRAVAWQFRKKRDLTEMLGVKCGSAQRTDFKERRSCPGAVLATLLYGVRSCSGRSKRRACVSPEGLPAAALQLPRRCYHARDTSRQKDRVRPSGTRL